MDNLNILNIVLDVLMGLAVLIPFIQGLKNGLIKTVFRFFRTAAAFVLSWIFAPRVGEFLKDKFIYDLLHEKISNGINRYLSSHVGTVNAETMSDAVPEALRSVVSFLGVNVEDVAENAALAGQNALADFSGKLADICSTLTAVAVAFVGLLLVGLVALRIVGYILDKIVSHTPVAKQLNRLLGGVAGAGVGVLIAWALAQLLVMLLGFIGDVDYSGTYLLTFFYRFSPLQNLLNIVLGSMTFWGKGIV